MNGPMIFVHLSGPPPPDPPLTVGGVAARFVRLDHDAHPIQLTTDYANPRMQDPLSPFRMKRLTEPVRLVAEVIVDTFVKLVP